MIARSLRMNDSSKSSAIRLISYLTDTQGHNHRVADVHTTNCDSDDAQWAALEIVATQRMNTRASGDKLYHLVLSFQSEERPSIETIREIESEVCAHLGFEAHQRIAVLHDDTDNLHLHLCINKIHPDTLTMHTPYYDHKTLAVTCTRLEKQHGLVVDNHIPKSEAVETAAKNMEHGGDMDSLIGWIQRSCLQDLKQADSWDALHTTLHRHGLEIRERGNGFVIQSGELHVKASSIDRSLSKKRLEERFGPYCSDNQRGQSESSASQKYMNRPMPRDSFDTSSLWQQFQTWSAEHDQNRANAMMAARQLRDEELRKAQQLADVRTLVIRHMVTGTAMKRILHALNRSRLKQKREQVRKDYRAQIAKSRKASHSTGANPSWSTSRNWRTWLQEEARAGNADALAALRARDTQRHRNLRSMHTMAHAVKVTSKGTILYANGTRDTGLPKTQTQCPVFNQHIEHHQGRGR